MMRSLLLSFVVAAAPLAVLQAQTVQLADGRVLLATVDPGDVDGEGLRVRRLDNGGVLDLRWDQLSSASAWELKRKFSLVGDTQDEVLTRAEEITYMVGGSRQSRIGRVVDRTATHIVVQAKGDTFQVPAADVVTVRTVDVPVTQVFTKDEYHQQLLATQPPGDDADKHVLLAETLIKVSDYEHAAEHLEKAKALGNSRDPQKVEAALARLQRFKEAAKELELLSKIEAARRRGQLPDFEKGKTLIAQFEKDFPQTKLKAEFDLEKRKFADARTRTLATAVAEQWRRSIQVVAEKKVVETGLTLQAARDYAESKMTDDIVARLVTLLHLEAEEVKQLWTDREKFPVGKRAELFAYGIGSWVLGEKAILKDTDAGKAKDKQSKQPEAVDQRSVEQYARALREALQRRSQAGAGAGAEKEMTDEEWWSQATRADRIRWLSAYYAEFGGQLKLTFASVSPCISCYGEGTTPDMAPDGKQIRAKCFLCQQQKWLRSFKAY